MKIGITVWQDRVSPVLDTAQKLMIVDTAESDGPSQQVLVIPELPLPQKAQFISHTGLKLLICGAVSRFLEHSLRSEGVEVVPWIRGPIHRVISAYRDDKLEDGNLRLPGCPKRVRGQRRGQGRRQGGRRGRRGQEEI